MSIYSKSHDIKLNTDINNTLVIEYSNRLLRIVKFKFLFIILVICNNQYFALFPVLFFCELSTNLCH